MPVDYHTCEWRAAAATARRAGSLGIHESFSATSHTDSAISLYSRSISAYLSKRIGEKKMEEAVRWSVKVSRETDLTLRTYLGARGMKKGDLSKFIEEAVRWRILSRTVRDIKARNANANVNELQAIIDGAVREVRAELRAKKKRPKA